VIFVLFILLVLGLLAYGNLVAYLAVRAPALVAVNLALATGLLALGRGFGLSWHALGLDASGLPSGLLWGGIVALVIGLAGAVIRLTPLRRAFRDLRTVDLRPPAPAFHYLIRIPLGTSLFEEILFRGFLLALLARAGFDLGAVIWSSVLFGLWHVGASLDFLRANRPRAGTADKVLAIVAGVAFTTVGGIGFAVLRVAAESLVAPILAHAAINVTGFALARAEPPTHP
jgi:membrane protease YdiL (CAAX protease family)